MVQKQKTLHCIESKKKSNSFPEYWEQFYKDNNIGWDLGGITPIFNNWIKKIDKKKTICVLGAGNGWDALNFADIGHDVVAVDFAPTAIKNIVKKTKKKSINIKALQLDIFDLPSYYQNYFDIVIEYTCFCAIDPDDRENYIKMVNNILKHGGKFVGILFPLIENLQNEGPPFYVDLKKTLLMFDNYLTRLICEKPSLSIKPRKNREAFVVYRKNEI